MVITPSYLNKALACYWLSVWRSSTELKTFKSDSSPEVINLSRLAEAVAEPEEAPQHKPKPKPKKTETPPTTKTASEQALADGWLLVDLSAQA